MKTDSRYVILVLVALLMAAWVVFSKKAEGKIGPEWTFILLNIPAFAGAVTLCLMHKLPSNGEGVALALAGGACGSLGFFLLLGVMGSLSGAAVSMMNNVYPVIAVLIFALLGEALTVRSMIGVALVFVGAVLVVRS